MDGRKYFDYGTVFMNKFWLTFFFFFASFLLPLDKKDLSKPICLNSEKSGSVEHSSGVGALLTLGLSLAGKFECAFYRNLRSERQTVSDCRELMCRAKNRSLIVERGQNIIKLSEEIIKENKPGTSKTKLNRGIKKIENGIEQWNKVNTVSENATVDDVSTKTLEKYLNIPLEKFINDQFSSLPKDFQSSYSSERRRIYEEELEKKRIAAEKKRKEQEKKKREEMALKAQIRKEKEIEEIRQNTNIFLGLLGLGGLIALGLILSYRRAMKELELSKASALGSKDSFFSNNKINIDSLNSGTEDNSKKTKSATNEKTQNDNDEVNSDSFFETNEIDYEKITKTEEVNTKQIEVVNYKYDFDSTFDEELYFKENLSSLNWNTYRQVLLGSVTDSRQFPNKKVYVFDPNVFALSLKLIDLSYKAKEKTPEDGEEYFGESKDMDAYLKISDDVSLLVEPWRKSKEELNSLFDTDTELKSLYQLQNEAKTQEEKEAIAIQIYKNLLRIKQKFKELEIDILKEVELIIYRSELAEEIKKKLIDSLPEAIGLDG